jgi:hypothetical protein
MPQNRAEGSPPMNKENSIMLAFGSMSAMKILVLGATGSVGRRLVAEGLQRGHRITAFVRFFCPPFFYSQVARAAVPLGCIVLMVVQWLAYRKAVRGTHLAFVSFVVVGFGLANLRLALNAAWLYTFNGELSKTQILMRRTHVVHPSRTGQS